MYSIRPISLMKYSLVWRYGDWWPPRNTSRDDYRSKPDQLEPPRCNWIQSGNTLPTLFHRLYDILQCNSVPTATKARLDLRFWNFWGRAGKHPTPWPTPENGRIKKPPQAFIPLRNLLSRVGTLSGVLFLLIYLWAKNI